MGTRPRMRRWLGRKKGVTASGFVCIAALAAGCGGGAAESDLDVNGLPETEQRSADPTATADEIVCFDAHDVAATLAEGGDPTAALSDGDTVELIMTALFSVEYLIGDVDDAAIAPAAGTLRRLTTGSEGNERNFGEFIMEGVDAIIGLRDACENVGYPHELAEGAADVRACYQMLGLEDTIANPGRFADGGLDGRIQMSSNYIDWMLTGIVDDELRSAATRLSTSVASRDYDEAADHAARGADRCGEIDLPT